MNLAVRIEGVWSKLGESVRIGDFIYSRETLEGMDDEEREALEVVTYQAAGPVPAGQRVVSSYLADYGAGLVEKYVFEAIPLEERKANLLALIDAERDRRQQLDVVYDFGDIEAIDDDNAVTVAGAKALQMRFDPDQRNWLGLQSQALAAVITGQGGMTMPMRAEDNYNVQTTAMQVLGATAALFARNAAILFHGGSLKTQVRNASNGAALDAINISIGWPG